MEIGTAKTESAYCGAARRISMGQPGTFFGRQIEGGAAFGYFIQRFLHFDRGWQHLVVQGQGGLDHARRSGRGLGMSDLGFDRTE